jgi:hypothetical protein
MAPTPSLEVNVAYPINGVPGGDTIHLVDVYCAPAGG